MTRSELAEEWLAKQQIKDDMTRTESAEEWLTKQDFKEGLGYDVGMDDESYNVRLLEDLEDEDAKRRMIRAIMMEARLKTPEGDRVLQDTVDTASQNLMMMVPDPRDEDMFNRRMADVEDRMAQRSDPMLF